MNPYPQLPWFTEQRAELRALPGRGIHAVLLHGARGIGKKSLALDAARDVLCESPLADGSACGTCSGCALTAADNHPDLRVVVPDALSSWRLAGSAEEGEAEAEEPGGDEPEAKRESREIRIDQIRELADFFGIATHRAGRRVVVLAPADALNAAAANAALKTLEEPPPGTFFLLCSDAIDEVLPTVRSRCMLYRVPAPAAAPCASWLVAQGIEAPADRLAAAGGAPLDALAEAREEAAEAVLPPLLRWLQEGGRPGLGAIGGLRIPKTFAAESAIRVFQRWGWDLLAHRSGAAVRYHPSLKKAVESLGARVSSERALLDWQQQLARLRRESAHPALNAKALIEDALIGYSSLFAPLA
jgi:DNA polymerase-3 subunit delta'